MNTERITTEELQGIDALDIEREGLPKSITVRGLTPEQHRSINVMNALATEAPRLVAEIRKLKAEAARDETHVQQIEMAWQASKAERDRYGAMLDEALLSLAAAGIVTPAKGFRGELVIALSRHIDELREQRDHARRELALMTKRAQEMSQAVAAPLESAPRPMCRPFPDQESENPEPLS